MTGLLGLGLLTACTNDELSDNFAPNQNEGGAKVQIALTIANTAASSRAVPSGDTGSEEYGDDNEYIVNDLLVVFANAAGRAQYVYEVSATAEQQMKDATNSTQGDDKLIRVTKPFEVEPMLDAYVYVIANYQNSKNALSPIIQGQTDMNTVFDITDATKLSASGNFLMSNATKPTKQTIYAEKSLEADTNYKDEVKDDGTSETNNPEKVQLLEVEIQRAVAKVTFDQTKTTGFEIKDASDNTIATVDLTGAELINLNKKMYMVMDESKATNKPSGITGEWAYPKDPNYDNNNTLIADATALAANFSNPAADYTAWATGEGQRTFANAVFYCPENTMTDVQQKNGVTTGVVYRAKWTINTTTESGKANGFTELSKDGTDYLSQRFSAVLAKSSDEGFPTTITQDVFTTADQESGTFYTFAGYIFRNKAAACLYKVLAENSEASAAITAYGTLYAKSFAADEADPATAATTGKIEEDGIYKYKGGVCYYPVWIMHNPDATVAMQQDKYGVVRNHWYLLTVQSISELGNYKPTYDDPDNPDDPEKAKIQVQAKIKKWTLVKQNVNL